MDVPSESHLQNGVAGAWLECPRKGAFAYVAERVDVGRARFDPSAQPMGTAQPLRRCGAHG